jgi:hypothetical protein
MLKVYNPGGPDLARIEGSEEHRAESGKPAAAAADSFPAPGEEATGAVAAATEPLSLQPPPTDARPDGLFVAKSLLSFDADLVAPGVPLPDAVTVTLAAHRSATGFEQRAPFYRLTTAVYCWLRYQLEKDEVEFARMQDAMPQDVLERIQRSTVNGRLRRPCRVVLRPSAFPATAAGPHGDIVALGGPLGRLQTGLALRHPGASGGRAGMTTAAISMKVPLLRAVAGRP